jgi:hypothetical protein
MDIFLALKLREANSNVMNFSGNECMNLILVSILISLTAFCRLSAEYWVKSYALEAYAGPEIYWVARSKSGGTKQSGMLYGVRAGYDHIHRYKFYWGIDALWARGELTGKSEESRLKSILTDINVEARIGYTFQSKYWRCASFTPFIGGGYFWETNCYQHPSPLHVHFKNRFSYIPFGFLSQLFITQKWSVGVNFKVRYLLESQQDVTNDPEHKKLIQHYEERLQYRAELPITYFTCWKTHSLAVSLVPFYEYRSYGYRANFPFDFFETKLNLYGATLKFLYLF